VAVPRLSPRPTGGGFTSGPIRGSRVLCAQRPRRIGAVHTRVQIGFIRNPRSPEASGVGVVLLTSIGPGQPEANGPEHHKVSCNGQTEPPSPAASGGERPTARTTNWHYLCGEVTDTPRARECGPARTAGHFGPDRTRGSCGPVTRRRDHAEKTARPAGHALELDDRRSALLGGSMRARREPRTRIGRSLRRRRSRSTDNRSDKLTLRHGRGVIVTPVPARTCAVVAVAWRISIRILGGARQRPRRGRSAGVHTGTCENEPARAALTSRRSARGDLFRRLSPAP
jgi:hypothetical protein